MKNRVLLLSILTLLLAASIGDAPVQGVSSNIVISEFRTRGPNGGSDEFIELYNLSGAAVNIGGWKIKGSNNLGSVSTRVTITTGVVLNPGCHYLVTNSSTSGGPYSGSVPGNQTYSTGITDNGGIAATTPSDVVVDAVGMDVGSAFKEGTVLPPLTTNVNRGYERRPGGTSGSGQDTDNNLVDFQLLAPSDPQNLSSACIDTTTTNPTGTGAADPSSVEPGGSTLLTVTVTPGKNPTSTGLQVTGDLTAIGGSMAQMFFDDGVAPDAVAGDNIFVYSATVALGTTPGNKSLPISLTDAENRSGSTTIALTVLAPLVAIHDIQGSGTTSPYAGQLVRTTGIVTALRTNGFFVQTPDNDADGDPSTSEGIFVFTSSAPPVAAAVGNRVQVSGTVQEFIPSADPVSPPITEIAFSPTVTQLSTGNLLPTPVTLTAADTSPTGSLEQLERFEGMRVHVDSLTAVSPTSGFVNEASATSTSNGIFFAVITGVARTFREPGIHFLDPLPPGSPCCVPRYDGDPERLRVDSDAQPGAAQLEVTSGTLVTNVTGVLDFAFRTWSIYPDPAPTPALVGVGTATPVPAPAIDEFTVGSFNLQRFFDTTNDPGISDPVLTTTAFANRLNKASLAVREVMSSPDILGVEEVENLSTLQALAMKLNNDTVAGGEPHPGYVAYLEEGNDVGGIDVGFLVKSTRVSVIEVTQVGKDATFTNPDTLADDLIFDRPPLILRATILSPVGPDQDLTVIANHLRSLSGIDDPADGNRVRHKRRAGAEYLANFAQERQTADPDERIVLIGDFNAFEFNDGYVDVIGTLKGTPTPANMVVLASEDLVNPDLIDLIEGLADGERYSFILDGSSQVLDHDLVSANAQAAVRRTHYARNNADFPESFRNNPNRPERISDHDMPVVYFSLPPIEVAIDIKPGEVPNSINLGSQGTVPAAVLSSPTFDARAVSPASLVLAGAPVATRGRGRPMVSYEDVNGDGLADLVAHFPTELLQLTLTSTEATLTGNLFNGKRIHAVDSVNIVP
jgi:hypothetical protein